MRKGVLLLLVPFVLIAVVLIVAVGAIFRSIGGLRSTGTAVIAQCIVGVIAVAWALNA